MSALTHRRRVLNARAEREKREATKEWLERLDRIIADLEKHNRQPEGIVMELLDFIGDVRDHPMTPQALKEEASRLAPHPQLTQPPQEPEA